jgi:hypothetical protein
MRLFDDVPHRIVSVTPNEAAAAVTRNLVDRRQYRCVLYSPPASRRRRARACFAAVEDHDRDGRSGLGGTSTGAVASPAADRPGNGPIAAMRAMRRGRWAIIRRWTCRWQDALHQSGLRDIITIAARKPMSSTFVRSGCRSIIPRSRPIHAVDRPRRTLGVGLSLHYNTATPFRVAKPAVHHDDQ